MNDDVLLLDNQFCFRFYTVSRLITKHYQPFLSKLGITYPQYLVLMVLWEQDNQPVNDIAKRLYLETNTVTPILQRMEKQKIVVRKRDKEDQRKVIISLTAHGIELKEQARTIPTAMANKVSTGINQFFIDNNAEAKRVLDQMIDELKETI
uniref:HTH-type transcriptional regulator SarZ n=4 Tax=unclassified Prevotella TaxID=2638335 RepID=A0AB33JJM2_9BACT